MRPRGVLGNLCLTLAIGGFLALPATLSAGDLFWKGRLTKGQVIRVEAGQPSVGVLDGDSLPGHPVVFEKFSGAIEFVEAPGPGNGWKSFSFRSLRSINSHVTINFRWTPDGPPPVVVSRAPVTEQIASAPPVSARRPITPPAPKAPVESDRSLSAEPGPRPAAVATAASPGADLVPLATYSDPSPSSLESKKKIEERCEALLAWLSRLEREHPSQGRRGFSREAQTASLFLYRDEDFRPLFGQPYDATTQKDREKIYESSIARCQGNAVPARFVPKKPVREYMDRFWPYSAILEKGFANPAEHMTVVDAVRRGRQARQWMNGAVARVGAASATVDGFAALGEALHGPQDLWNSLWPSEQQHLRQIVATRKTEFASIITGQWVDDIAAFGSTLDSAARLRDEHARRRTITAIADPAVQQRASAAYEAKLDAILGPLVGQHVEKLPAIAPTLQGAEDVLAWKRSFDESFGPWSERRSVAAAVESFQTRRREILEAALPEWEELIDSPEPTSAELEEHALRLAVLFDGALGMPIQSRYRQALDEQVERKAQADYANAADECDRLAAHPADPEAVAAGLADGDVVAAEVVPVCESAIRLDGAAPRLYFQLARGYLADQRLEEAVDALIVAADEGHGASLAYLADLTLDGIGGIEADFEVAYGLYEQAATAGFEPATAVLAEFEDVTAEAQAADAEEEAFMAELRKTNPELFSETGEERLPPPNTEYASPRIVDNVHSGDLDAVPYGENYTKAYLLEMAGIIGDVCEGQHFSEAEIAQLKVAAARSIDTSLESGYANLRGFFYALGAVAKAFESGALAQPQAKPKDAVHHDEDELPLNAMKDGFAFISRYPCGSPEIDDFKANLTEYMSEESFSQTRIMRTCVAEARPAGRYSRSDFCDCFLGILGKTHVSRARRRALSSSFWPTAQGIIGESRAAYGVCIEGF